MKLNPFATVLLSESLLKGNDASLTIGHPHTITVPIKRGDCPGWSGVRITLEAIPSPQDAKESNPKADPAGVVPGSASSALLGADHKPERKP